MGRSTTVRASAEQDRDDVTRAARAPPVVSSLAVDGTRAHGDDPRRRVRSLLNGRLSNNNTAHEYRSLRPQRTVLVLVIRSLRAMPPPAAVDFLTAASFRRGRQLLPSRVDESTSTIVREAAVSAPGVREPRMATFVRGRDALLDHTTSSRESVIVGRLVAVHAFAHSSGVAPNPFVSKSCDIAAPKAQKRVDCANGTENHDSGNLCGAKTRAQAPQLRLRRSDWMYIDREN